MKSEDERLVRPAVQLAGQDPTRPSVENRIWESFCEWHYREHGWEPSKDQRYESGTHTRNVWQAYQEGAALALEAQTTPAPADEADSPFDEELWARFSTYYKDVWGHQPSRRAAMMPRSRIRDAWEIFQAALTIGRTELPPRVSDALIAKRETLRDEFAGQAMQGLLSRYPVGSSIDKPDIAYQSYRMAQEMMRMRDKQIRNP